MEVNSKVPLFFFFLVVFSFSCREDVDKSSLQEYDGPISSSTNIHLVQSDSAIIRSDLKAPKQLEFANGNIEFPEGIDIQIFEKDGSLGTTMSANKGYYLKEENLYKGVGDVKVKNLIKDQQLQTEEIFWNPNEKRIYTDKFVTIQEKQTLFNGTGMESDDSFSNYKLKNVRDSRTLLPGEGM
jgi:LPS export ABC transporter protein LptC